MTTVSRWLPAITDTGVVRKAALGLAGLALTGGAIAGPMVASQDTAAYAAESSRSSSAASKVLNYRYKAQENYYYCAPAATQIALTAQGHSPSQDSVARKLGTTEAGTKSAEDTTRVLNSSGGKGYRTVEIPDANVKPEQMDQLQADVVRAVDSRRAVVANIKGAAVDTDGRQHSYPGGHYVTVVGYDDEGRKVKIADPADPSKAEYWMTTITLANWAAERGYSA